MSSLTCLRAGEVEQSRKIAKWVILQYYGKKVSQLDNMFSPRAKSIRKYVLGMHFLHKQLGWDAPALESFPVTCRLKATDLNMCSKLLRCLLTLLTLLHQLCSLADSRGPLGPPMKVCLASSFFALLCRINLPPRSAAAFDHLWHMCCFDISWPLQDY